MLGSESLLAALMLLGPAKTAPPPVEPAEQTEPASSEEERGKTETIYALLTFRAGIGPSIHPDLSPRTGLAIDARFGAGFVVPPLLAIWPELGASFQYRNAHERALGTVDLNVGFPAFLYYGVGFMAGVEGRARLLGVRHGLDLRFFQVVGVAVMHAVTETPVRGLQHEIQLMFSFDVLSMVFLLGNEGTAFDIGVRRVGR